MQNPPINSGSDRPLRVLCVDDNPDMVAVMRMMIDAEPLMRCVGCLASADDLVNAARRLSPAPDVVILDATMPGRSALESMSELTAEFPDIKTIVYSGYDDPEFIDRAKRAGAWGCISKRDTPDTLLRAVREAAAGNARSPRSGHRG
ncbi:MAG: response regulator transcription factor [Phycisphaerales bacterium]